MELSVFDLFKIGIGPSSSHTVGPMRGALRFAEQLSATGQLESVTRVRCDLYGSLALTGRGHATDTAVMLGLQGERPESVDPNRIAALVHVVRSDGALNLLGHRVIQYREQRDLVFHQSESLPLHPNGMRLTALDEHDVTILTEEYYSVGGGFVLDTAEVEAGLTGGTVPTRLLTYPFTSAADLLRIGQEQRLSIAEILRANETAWRPSEETESALDRIWQVMQQSIERGCESEGELPGGLGVRRRAPTLHRALRGTVTSEDPMTLLDWVSLFALAVNEENAAGGGGRSSKRGTPGRAPWRWCASRATRSGH